MSAVACVLQMRSIEKSVGVALFQLNPDVVQKNMLTELMLFLDKNATIFSALSFSPTITLVAQIEYVYHLFDIDMGGDIAHDYLHIYIELIVAI